MGEFGARRALFGLAPILATALLLAGCLQPVRHNGGNAAAAPEAPAPPAASGNPSLASLPPVDDNPDRLMGMDAAGLRAILGSPAFLRRDNPAQLWRYAATGCMLDLYLYRSGPGGTYVVRHLAARPAPGKDGVVSARACLGALLRAHRGAASG